GAFCRSSFWRWVGEPLAFRPLNQQGVGCLVGHGWQDAETMSHLQKLPLGVDNLLVPPIEEDSLLPQPFFVNGDRCRGRYARERTVLLDGNVKIFRLSQPAEDSSTASA